MRPTELVVPALLALLLVAPLEARHIDPAPTRTGPDVAEGHADDGHPFDDEVMLFVGDTRKRGASAFTVGFDYLRSLGSHWGAGVFFDHARDEFEREYILGAGLFVAPVPALRNLHLFAGAGWERLDEDHGRGLAGHGAGPTGGRVGEDLLLARVGGSLSLHLGASGRWVVAPQVFYDMVEGRGRDAVVFGLGFGLLF